MELIAVITTVGDHDEARAMARSLVERRLAACAQISRIESFYEWQGAVQDDNEYRILFKTTAARRAAVEAAIREQHSYELPAIFSLPMQHVDPAFADWVAAGCGEQSR
ncbi:divalent-cation tolerance protein CutA [Piscinibacter sakaiensis]|uniref:divalent-cation tolerance protein CutA n=1 Tax=Piscinibacter sakaiensis TaxID=1547922 RepID=UPI003AB049A2